MRDRSKSREAPLLAGLLALFVTSTALGDGAGLIQRNRVGASKSDGQSAKGEASESSGQNPAIRVVDGKTVLRALPVADGDKVPTPARERTTGWQPKKETTETLQRTPEPIRGGFENPIGKEEGGETRKPASEIDSLLDKATARPQTPASNPETPAQETEFHPAPPLEPTSAPSTKAGETEKPNSNFVSWRQRYELGPGDVLTFSFAGRSDLLREEVKISPEGTVSYLQAIQVKASGKTVDELRAAINEKLAAYHKSPKVIVTPVTVGSKRYTIMGQVRQSGTFPLDRPMNLLEAIAKSAGIQVGLSTSETVELADLERSFLVRGNRKMPVDFAKLYLDGDLSQNVQLEPEDYIYIASNLRNEYYLLGAVAQQGSHQLSSRLTVTGAIASAAGFSDRAWRQNVLLIRGSIHKPEATLVNVNDILRGRAKDIVIQPRDIIYVHTRPWAFVEDILDTAIKDFLSAASVSAVEKYGYGDRNERR